MNNNLNDKHTKKVSLRFVLGIAASLLFVFMVIYVLWAVGVLNSIIKIVIGIILSLVFVFSIGTVLLNAGVIKNKKK